MSLETLTEKVGEFTDRRHFMVKLGTAGLASAAYIGGVSAPRAEAQGCNMHGCGLCQCPGPCGPHYCAWCWRGGCGLHQGAHASPKEHQCCEGYRAGSNCGGSCTAYQICSFLGNTYDC